MQVTSKLLFGFLLVFCLSSCDELEEQFGLSEPEKSDIKDTFEDDQLAKCVATQTLGLKAKQVTRIICTSTTIRSLKGLEQFPNLQILILQKSGLQQVDLSPFPKLGYLDLSFNSLDEIDLSPFPNLFYLDLSSNSLDDLDISHNPKLEELRLNNNNLDNLDTANNSELLDLFLSENEISSLNLKNNIKLRKLELNENKFEGDVSAVPEPTLDLSQNTKLNNLELRKNKISNIDLSKNTVLNIVDLRDNELASIDLTKNTNLTQLALNDNLLTELDISENDNLDSLFAEDNLIASIKFPTNNDALLRNVHLKSNQISCGAVTCAANEKFKFPATDKVLLLDLSDNLIQVEHLELGENVDFTELNLSNNPNLEGSIDLSKFENMAEINLSYTGITHIDFGSTDYNYVFNNFDFLVIAAIDAPLDSTTKELLDAMQANRDNHPRFDPSTLCYIYQTDQQC